MLLLFEGPAGAGKSQAAAEAVRAGELDAVSDVSSLHAALTGVQRGPDGNYPVRMDNDPGLGLARMMQTSAVRIGLRHGLRMGVSTSQRGQAPHWAEVAAEEGSPFGVRTIDPGEDVVRARLADPAGRLSTACATAIGRWYG